MDPPADHRRIAELNGKVHYIRTDVLWKRHVDICNLLSFFYLDVAQGDTNGASRDRFIVSTLELKYIVCDTSPIVYKLTRIMWLLNIYTTTIRKCIYIYIYMNKNCCISEYPS